MSLANNTAAAVLAFGWAPEIRGILFVTIGVVALCGSVYLLLGTNLGFRLGFLVAMAGLFGWLLILGMVWLTYASTSTTLSQTSATSDQWSISPHRACLRSPCGQ